MSLARHAQASPAAASTCQEETPSGWIPRPFSLPAGYLQAYGIPALSPAPGVVRRKAESAGAAEQESAARPPADTEASPHIGAADDAVEHEADAVAERVVAAIYGRAAKGPAQGEGANADGQIDMAFTEAAQQAEALLSAKQTSGGAGSKDRACECGTCADCKKPTAGAEQTVRLKGESGQSRPRAMRSIGKAKGQTVAMPLPLLRAFAQVVGRDISGAIIVVGGDVDEEARQLNARAYTLGNRVFVRSDAYQPGTPAGDLLLAHELVHVAHGHAGGPGGGVVRRFERSERSNITNLDAVIETARTIASNRGGLGMMRWGRFTAGTGGSGAIEAISPKLGSTDTNLRNRYLFSCRCGLIDMRHFYQLMYIALLRSNRAATDMGRAHELQAEPTSRFAAEDSPSNAMGAYFGSQQSVFERQSTFVNHLREYLQRCNPVDFSTLSPADKDQVVEFYGSRQADGAPSNQNETATPAALNIAVCGGQDRTTPFTLDPDDPKAKTINGTR